MKKTISYDTFLKVKGLFHLANEHYVKALEYESALADILGFEDNYANTISDQIYEKGGSLEKGLEKEGIAVAKEKDK